MHCIICWYLHYQLALLIVFLVRVLISVCIFAGEAASTLTTMATDRPDRVWEDGLMSVKEWQVKEGFCPLIKIASRVQMWNGYWLVPSLSSSAVMNREHNHSGRSGLRVALALYSQVSVSCVVLSSVIERPASLTSHSSQPYDIIMAEDGDLVIIYEAIINTLWGP